MSDVGVALDFEDIKEENINETEFGSRLDELGKVAIKNKHLGNLVSLIAFIGYVRECEKDHEKTLQTMRNMMNSVEFKMKHTLCPPMKEVNDRLAKFIALAKKMKEKGRII